MSNLICTICGQPCLENAIISALKVEGPGENLAYYIMCPQCIQQANTCNLCTYRGECDFETNPSPLPKQIQQTVRQGQMVMQTIVQNPDRIRETCQKSCKCWSDEFGCLKQNGTCGHYKEAIPNVKM